MSWTLMTLKREPWMFDERYAQLVALCDEGIEDACNDLWLEFGSEFSPKGQGNPQEKQLYENS
jgi:hypothetical protein